MPKSTVDTFVDRIYEIAQQCGFSKQDLAHAREGRNERSVTIRLTAASQIWFEAAFGLQHRREALYVRRIVFIRWPAAQELYRDHLPRIFELPAEIRIPADVRKRLTQRNFPVASLTVTDDREYFLKPNPICFESGEEYSIDNFFKDDIHTMKSRVVSDFVRYCDPQILCDALTSPTSISKLTVLPLMAAAIFAAANREAEFIALRDDWLSRKVPHTIDPAVEKAHEHYFQALSRELKYANTA